METLEISEYDVQANDFATKHGVSLTVLSHRFDSMAWDKDGQKRNIFKLKLYRGKKSYTFEFGSSVSDSCEKTVTNAWNELKQSDLFDVYCGIKSTKFGYASIKFSLTKENASVVSDEQIKNWSDSLYEEIESVIKKYNAEKSKWEHVFNTSKFQTENYVRTAIERAIKRLQSETKTVYLNQKREIINPSMYSVLTCLTKYDPGTFEDFCMDFGYDSDSISALRTYKAVCKEWKGVENLFSDVLDELQEIQ